MTSNKHVRTEIRDRILIVVLQSELGSLTDEGRDQEFDATIAEVANERVRHLLLDLTDASYFGSKVLEWMVSLWKRLREKEGHMALCNVSPSAREILAVAKFDTIWPIYDSREEALAGFPSE